ncbi:hypothetical protein ACI5FR_15520 [Paenibacillus sp. HJGM_3]
MTTYYLFGFPLQLIAVMGGFGLLLLGIVALAWRRSRAATHPRRKPKL